MKKGFLLTEVLAAIFFGMTSITSLYACTYTSLTAPRLNYSLEDTCEGSDVYGNFKCCRNWCSPAGAYVEVCMSQYGCGLDNWCIAS